jgi:hypothetical protein
MSKNERIAEFIKHYILPFIAGMLIASMSYELHLTAWLGFPYPELAIVILAFLVVYLSRKVAPKQQSRHS